jgi:hypothetical protein
MYPFREDVPLQTAPEIRDNVKQAAKNVESQALEKNIAVKELKYPTSIGFYYRVTDKSPKAGEFKYMIQGQLLFRHIILIFSIFTNDGADGIEDDAMVMLRKAIHNP